MLRTSRTSTATRTGTRGGIVVEGVDSVVTEFARKAVGIRLEAAAVAVKAAGRAAERMRNRVPIGPPTLHVLNSITSDQTATFAATSVYAAAGPDPTADEGAFVARFLEHGTVHQAPQPFVGPAERETSPEFLAALKALT